MLHDAPSQIIMMQIPSSQLHRLHCPRLRSRLLPQQRGCRQQAGDPSVRLALQLQQQQVPGQNTVAAPPAAIIPRHLRGQPALRTHRPPAQLYSPRRPPLQPLQRLRLWMELQRCQGLAQPWRHQPLALQCWAAATTAEPPHLPESCRSPAAVQPLPAAQPPGRQMQLPQLVTELDLQHQAAARARLLLAGRQRAWVLSRGLPPAATLPGLAPAAGLLRHLLRVLILPVVLQRLPAAAVLAAARGLQLMLPAPLRAACQCQNLPACRRAPAAAPGFCGASRRKMTASPPATVLGRRRHCQAAP